MFKKGKKVGPYILLEKIGRGGFAEVWLAEKQSELMANKVAVKLPFEDNIDLNEIKKEVELWAKASGHINVLPIFEANIYLNQVVIVSEYAPDGSLEKLINENRALTIEQASNLIIGILNGLTFLHSKHIIHRDIKPANVLLQGNTPRLADFGISRIMQTSSMSTNIAGTPAYMAPEAFDGKRNVQTDIWSVGVMFYRMLTGELPFPHNNTSEMIKAIVLENPTLLPESFPKEIGIIINQALAKEPFERYKSAEQMRSDLQKFLFKFKSSSTKNFINPFIENIGSTRDSAKTKTAFNKDFKNKQSTKKHQFIDSNNKKNKISLGKYQITGVFALLLLLATYLLYSGTLKNYFQKNQNELDNSSTIKSKSESLESKNINLNTTNKINSNRIDSDKSQSQEVKTEPANQSNLSLKPILKVRKEKSLK